MNQLSGILGFEWSILSIPAKGYYFTDFSISLPSIMTDYTRDSLPVNLNNKPLTANNHPI